MSRIFRDNSLPRTPPVGMQADKKLWRKLQSKRIALGHKPNDHPDSSPTMTMG